MKAIKTLFILFLMAVAFGGGIAYRTWAGAKKKEARKVLYYVDPMHPWYKSDKPGIAPDCGMKLEPVYEGGAPPKEERKVLYYRDPKDPKYRAGAPGINPETGNDLEPVYEDMPAGAVQVAADKQQLLGLRYGAAEMTSVNQTIRAVGRVAQDETRIERVHSKVEGWIEKVFVDYTGELVKKGQPLLTLYSPEMLASQQEYLLAIQSRETMNRSSVSSLRGSGDALVDAARRRLALWDLSLAQIEQIEKTGEPIKSITLYSPASGYVTEREAFPNQKIGPETKLYTIADLSRVWIMADIYESDAALIRVGQTARITPAGTAGPGFSARVTFIQPQFDAATRTMKARLEAPNPGYRLKPEMYVDVEFNLSDRPRLTVPAEAVINSGTAQTVFVDRGNGNLEQRNVETGARIGGRIEILRGLKPGERIVASGAFLLNSESQMRSGAPMRDMPNMGDKK